MHISNSKSILFILLIFPILFRFPNIKSQNPASFFPHQVGDLWEYIEVDMYSGGIIDTFQAFITSDTLDSIGNSHVYFDQYYFNQNLQLPRILKMKSFPIFEYVIDSSFNVYYCGSYLDPINSLTYKLDAHQGDQWVNGIFPDSITYSMVRLKEVYQDWLFGELRIFKTFVYFISSDSSDTTGLVMSYHTLVEGIGLISEGGTHDVGYITYLLGAVIDGILYGDTTYVSTFHDSPGETNPNTFDLFQNYPNPFNSMTTIRFIVHENSRIILKIYDISGKEVICLIDDQILRPGEIKIHWDGKDKYWKNTSSGIYFYQLIVNEKIQTKQMLLLR